MNSKIDSYSNAAATAAVARATPIRHRVDSDPAAPTAPAAKDDSVHLTGDARLLQQVEKDVAASPDIDHGKVLALRRAISAGRFQDNPTAVASKLMRSEWELGGSGK